MNLQDKNSNPYFIVSRTGQGRVKVDMIHGDRRIKQKGNWVQEYFDDLLQAIREIRASEKDYYSKIREIFACCTDDYNPHNPETRDFFSTVQNKFFWAVTGQTASEIISRRADAKKPYMGIRTWKNGPDGKIRKADAYIAKNYLTAGEVHDLEQLVSQFLEYAIEQIGSMEPLTFAEWNNKLDTFLEQQERDLLPQEEDRIIYMIEEIVETEYQAFRHGEDPCPREDYCRI